MYFAGEPAQDHDKVPVLVLTLVGTTVIVTAWPVLVPVASPYTTIVPSSCTVPPDSLPTMLSVIFEPIVATLAVLFWKASDIAVRALEAANTSSDTFARTV